jgi:cysteine desulfuration protein SufE
MPDPFVVPEEPTAAAAIAAIGDELDVFDDWMDRYQFIIELGRKLPPFPEAWQNDAHRVPGCQSKVWMEAVLRGGKLYLGGLSDAAIVSGLIALLLRVYSWKRCPPTAATASPRWRARSASWRRCSRRRDPAPCGRIGPCISARHAHRAVLRRAVCRRGDQHRLPAAVVR